MNTSMSHCFVCGSTEFHNFTDEYRRCAKCGHETLVATGAQGFILNDPLTLKDAKQVTGLDRFKSRTLVRFDSSHGKGVLVDIGSASGKFLYLNQGLFRQAVGLEITPEALEFSRNVLNIDVKDDVLDLPKEIAVATAWHSLEHIPEAALIDIITSVSRKMGAESRLIVSVPNGASRQYRWFRSAYAYFDTPNHLHQFTETSLKALMLRCGLEPVAFINSWPYNTFGYIQGLLNIVTNTHNYLYYRLKRRSLRPNMVLDCLHLLFLPFFVPVGWLLALLDLLDMSNQGVITACFKRKDV
jgi:hypothetical protein